MSLEDNYYKLLTRLDHPVFSKDFEDAGQDSNFNSVLNRCLAYALNIVAQDIKVLFLDMYPHKVTSGGIDNWEVDYFDFTKPGKDLETRRDELLKWMNSDIGMSRPDVVSICEAIVGKTPQIIVNANKGSFVLGANALGTATILAGEDNTENRYTYIVRFTTNITTAQAKRLDEELTKIEKGGSKHIISFPPAKWVLGESSLGVDSYLRS